jgi:hypothetical protein
MSTLAVKVMGSIGKTLTSNWQTLSHIIFGAFIGGLVVLLILLYAGVPIVAGV